MAYFADLSPYSYSHQSQRGVVHVGWLDGVHPFPTGTVEVQLIEKVKVLAQKPVELYRGYHYCEVCVEPPGLIKAFPPHNKYIVDPDCSWARWWHERSGNGEIRVALDGVIYAAPVLIVHYIEEHGYLPPAQFLRAIEAATENLPWNGQIDA